MLQFRKSLFGQLLMAGLFALSGCMASPSSESTSNQAGIIASPGTLSQYESTPIGAYVTHLYKGIFNRNPDPMGFDYWVNAYQSGRADCRTIARLFLSAPEHVLRNELLADSTDPAFGALYIHELYGALFNRDADQAGSNFWVSALRNGVSVQAVEDGFLSSSEFRSVCQGYGIQ